MKPDKLEKFMLENREHFDVHGPPDELWENINKRVRPARKLQWQRVVWQSAAAVAIFLGSWIIHDLVQKGGAEGDLAGEEMPAQMVDERMQELVEAEVFYTSRINTARDEIFMLSGNDENLMQVLDYDLKELEQVFEELKNDLKDDGDNQEVIEAMIQNYRIKLGILEEMLLQLKKSSKPDENVNKNEI